MTKIDRRKSYYIVLDTETAPLDRSVNGVKPKNMLVYDIGYAVVDKQGNIYETYSFVVAETWIDHADLMQTAYYADKLPQYKIDIKNGTRQLASIYTIRKHLHELSAKYDVKAIVGHNMAFDVGSLNNTIRFLTKSKTRYFFPFGVPLWDSLKMAQSTLGQMVLYKEWCKDNGFVTKNNRTRFTAEILFRYLTNQPDFVEKHTALADVLIESVIFTYCNTRHRKGIKRRLYATA